MSESSYRVAIEKAAARPLAAVRARLRVERVPLEFRRYLDQVYELSRTGTIQLDGQNVFVYRPSTDGTMDVDFGVGVTSSFDPAGAVVWTQTPAGAVATATHRGSYAALGAAHEAVKDWCRDHGRRLAGPRWEVYGHWTDDVSQLRTDVYYLLEE